jgi:hypothetical protein
MDNPFSDSPYNPDEVNTYRPRTGTVQQQQEAPPPPQPQAQSNPFNYEAARDAWMSGRYSKDEAGVRQWNSEYNALRDYNGGDTGTLINGGGMIDLLGNFKSGNNVTANWTPAGGNGLGGTDGSGNAGGYGSGYTGFPPTSGLPTNPPPPPGVSKELYDMLLARAKQGTTIDRNDSNIRQQVDPYAAAQERARRNYLADAAEQLGPTANLRGESRVAMERAGQATGAFEGQLIGRELENRRSEIQHALDSLGNRLTEDQRIALQKELGYLSDATQRYGIDSNERQNNAQVGLGRDRLGLDYSELDWRMDPRNPSNYV